MRKSILAILLALFVLCMPQVSHAATCTLDEATVGGTDATCPISGTNNFLPSNGFNSARLQPSNILSGTPININNICRFVDARGVTAALFVPFNTSAEWTAFIANRPTGTNVAQCCIARDLRVSDVPRPTDTCNAGNWNLQGLVATTSSTTYLGRPANQRQDAPINLVSSQIEDPDYPIDTLPVDRDDVGSVFPTGARVDQTYIARWQCVGRQTVGHSTEGRTTDITGGTVGVINGEIGDITFTTFRMQCRNANWTTIDPNTCVETLTAGTQTCVQNDHPNTWTGAVYVLNRKNCPSGNITTTKIFDGCRAPVTCTPSSVDTTVPCPTGYTGNITRTTARVCDGSNGGLGRDVVTDNSSQCVPVSCIPGQVGDNFTETCGPSFTGSAIYKYVRSCPTGSVNGVLTKTLVSNTCVCPPTTDLGNVNKVCPTGQTGNQVVQQTRICVQAQPTGDIIAPWGICSCSITETPVSSTCTTDCVPGLFGDTFTAECATGQTGIITKRKSRACPSGTVTDVEISNTCTTNTCVPGLFGDAFTAPCPSGQTGIVTKRKSRACPSGVVTDVETGNTCTPQVCTPGQVGETFAFPCPTGQIGVITKKHVRACPSGIITDEIVNNSCIQVVGCIPGEISRSAVDCGNRPGSIFTINTRVCDGSNGGAGRIVTTTDNQCGVTGCVPSRTVTFEACPTGQTGSIKVITKHVCHSRHGWNGWEDSDHEFTTQTDGQGNGQNQSSQSGDQNNGNRFNWRRWFDGGERDIIIRENNCRPATTCTPSDTTSSRACPSGYSGQINVRTQHICDGSYNGLGRDIITQTSQCVLQCVTGPTCNPYTSPCPSGQTGVITRQNFRVCPSGDIEVRELSNTCRSSCTPSSTTVESACPSGQSGIIRTTTARICDGSNGGVGRETVSVDNQCRTQCTPSIDRTTRACPTGQSGEIEVTTRRICDGSNGGLGRTEVRERNRCSLTCVPNVSMTIEDCAIGFTGGRTTRTERICDGSNGGAGRVVTTVTGEICRAVCTPSTSSVDAPCPTGQSGIIRTTTARVCDGSNGGVGRITTTVDNQCRVICTPSSNSVDSSCPSGQTGYIRTTTARICDGSNGGAGRDTTTTDNQCRAVCTPGATCSPYTRACPPGQVGIITLHRVRQCPSGNEVEEVISNTCRVPVTCTPTSVTTPHPCPYGYTGAIYVNNSHICDGSNGGAGRDTTSTNDQCSIIIVTGGDGGGDGGGTGDGGGGDGDGGGCGDGGGGDGGD